LGEIEFLDAAYSCQSVYETDAVIINNLQECNLRPLSQVHRDLQLRFAEKEGPGMHFLLLP